MFFFSPDNISVGDSFNGLFERATPVLLPQYDKESLQSLQRFVDQIPKVLDQVVNSMFVIDYIAILEKLMRLLGNREIS